jgi:hypothetical protein
MWNDLAGVGGTSQLFSITPELMRPLQTQPHSFNETPVLLLANSARRPQTIDSTYLQPGESTENQ